MKLEFPLVIHFNLAKVALTFPKILLIANRHLIFVLSLKILKHLGGLRHPGSIFNWFHLIEHLAHFIPDFIVEFFLPINLYPIEGTDQYLNIFLILFGFFSGKGNILVGYGIVFLLHLKQLR